MTDEERRKFQRLQCAIGQLNAAGSANSAALTELQEQVDEIVGSSATTKGGMTNFIADGSATVLNIVHNLGAIPDYFTLTTTTPISPNHLNRSISWPDNNTMRITFNFAPLPGEDADYVWSVTKNS